MEFKFRGIDDRTAPYRSSPSTSSQSSSYLSDDQALRGNYSMDPNLLNNPRHFYTIQREIEKQIIRREIITREVIAEEIERRLGMGFGNDVLPPTLPHFSHGLWSGLDVNKKDKRIMLGKPDSNICGSKQKAATPPAGSGELPSASSSKPKEWSCALCQVSATTKRGLDVHLQGKKHKAKVAGLLRDKKMCGNSTSSMSKKSTESRGGAGQKLKTKVQEESVKANKTVVGLNQKLKGGLDERLQGKEHQAKVTGLLRDKKMCGNSTSSTSKKSTESRGGAGQKMKTKVEEESVKANKTVVGLNQRVKGGLNERLQGKKHKAKVAGLLRVKKMCSNSTSSTSKKSTEIRGGGGGQKMKTKVQEESVKANKTVVGLNQKVKVGLDEHPQGKKHKVKEELLAAQKWTKNSTESRDSSGQEIKTKVEEKSVKANKTVVGLDQKEEGGQALQVKPYPNLCGSKQEAATLPADSGKLRLTSSKEPMHWSCALCQVSATSKRGLDEHLQGKKHKAKEAGLLEDQKMCSNPTSKNSSESGGSAGQKMKNKVQEESVKANKTFVGLNQKVKGGLDEHPQGKKHKVKEELLGAQNWTKKYIESRDGLWSVLGVNEKDEWIMLGKPYPNLCGSKQEAATLPADSGKLRLTSSKKPMHWSCALCQVSATSKRDLDVHPQGQKHKAKEKGLLGDPEMCSNSASKNSSESRGSASQEIKATVEEESVKANKTVVSLDQKLAGGQDEHRQGKKHETKEAELLGPRKMCTTSSSSTSKEPGKTIKLTESRDSAGQEMKAKVKAIKTVVGLDQKVEGEDDSGNKNEELPEKKDLIANTQKTTNGILTAEMMMKRKLPPREKFEFWCEDCQVGTHSAVVMEGHKRGKKHMARSNESKKNDETIPLTTSTTIVTPSEPTKNVEYEDVVAEESSEETADSDIEKDEDEEVVVYRGIQWA